MFIKRNEEIIREAFDKRAENIRADLKDIEFSEEYKKRKSEILSRPVNKRTKKAVFISRAASIAAVVCMVVVAGIVTTKIGASKDDTFKTKLDEKETEIKPVILESDEMPKELTTKIGDETKKLTYVSSSTAGRYNIHTYTDSAGNDYQLNDMGQINWFWLSSSEKTRLIEESNRKEDITEKLAQDIATALFKEIYPEYLKNSEITYSEYSNELECYEITITKLYGKDKFVDGERLMAHVHRSGVVTHWSVGSLEDMNGFDEKLLKGIDKETVDKYVLDYLEAKEKGSSAGCVISRASVVRVDESFALRVAVFTDSELEYVYYELK